MRNIIALLFSAAIVSAQNPTMPFNGPTAQTNIAKTLTDFSSLSSALSNIGATVSTLIVPATFTLTSNTTIPANVTYNPQSGAVMNCTGSPTITVNGPIVAGSYKIFGSGCTVVFTGNSSLTQVDAKWFGAAADGTTDDTAAINAVAVAAGNRRVSLANGTFAVCNAQLGKYNKIDMAGTLFVPTSACASSPVVQYNSFIFLQDNDQFLLNGLRVSCSGSSHVATLTGIQFGTPASGNNTAGVVTNNVSVSNCGVGMLMQGTQFSDNYNLHLYANTVGLKIYSDDNGGGGNSNSFYSPVINGGTVGIIMATDGTWPQSANYFYNFTLLSNTLAAVAAFGSGGSSTQVFHIYGAAPEINAEGGTSSLSVDGHTVKKATFYLSSAIGTLSDVDFEDAVANPEILAENGSIVNIQNSNGYNRDGNLFTGDANSYSVLIGDHNANGIVQNVEAYPSSMNPSSGSTLIGKAVLVPAKITNQNNGNLINPGFADTNGATSSGVAADAIYGTVSTVTHATSIGSQDTNRANIGNVIPNQTGNVEALVTLLIKSSVDCLYAVGGYGLPAYHFSLVAGKWTRVVILIQNPQQFGTGALDGGYTLVGWPLDTTGPTVSYTEIESAVQPLGSYTQDAPFSQIISQGLIGGAFFGGVGPYGVVTVAQLPTCNGNSIGLPLMVSNATSSTNGTIVAGTGSVKTSVLCDGSNWIVK